MISKIISKEFNISDLNPFLEFLEENDDLRRERLAAGAADLDFFQVHHHQRRLEELRDEVNTLGEAVESVEDEDRSELPKSGFGAIGEVGGEFFAIFKVQSLEVAEDLLRDFDLIK